MAVPRACQPFACALALLCAGAVSCPGQNLRVLESQVVDLGAHSITYNRVATPILKPTPTPAPESAAAVVPEAVPSAVELEEMRRWDSMRYACAFLSCTVYDGQFTEVEWYEDGQWVRFLTTINWHYLSQVPDFEESGSYYTFLMGIGDCSREEFVTFAGNSSAFMPRPWPFDLLWGQRQTGKSAWRLLAPGPAPKEITQAIESLHRYFDANRERLIREYNMSEAARIAQEQWIKEHPPVRKDSVVEFFPIRSRHAPDRLGLKPANFLQSR